MSNFIEKYGPIMISALAVIAFTLIFFRGSENSSFLMGFLMSILIANLGYTISRRIKDNKTEKDI